METKENEKLLALTKLIGRKDLSFGCLVEFNMFKGGQYFKLIDTKYFEDTNDIVELQYLMNGFINEISMDYCNDLTIRGFKIIGHPLLLSDILNGLSGLKITWYLCSDGELQIENDLGNKILGIFILDLSLPLFSSQSEDFKTFIYEAFNIK